MVVHSVKPKLDLIRLHRHWKHTDKVKHSSAPLKMQLMGAKSGWIPVWWDGDQLGDAVCGEKTKTRTPFRIWKRKEDKGRGRNEDAVRWCPHEHREGVGMQIYIGHHSLINVK